MATTRILQSAILLLFALNAGSALAKPDVVTVPPCPENESAAPVVAPTSCDGRELSEYTEKLADTMVSGSSRALVRVEFDEQARVRSVCVDEHTGRATWDARRRIAERLVDARALPAGPRCVAGKRIDLNRYEAKLAETRTAGGDCGLVTLDRMKALRPCKRFDSDWIVYDRVGAMRPYLFLKTAAVGGSEVPASETLMRCGRTARGFEAQSECIQSDGFEMLTPESD
jgi:hypothetical protein